MVLSLSLRQRLPDSSVITTIRSNDNAFAAVIIAQRRRQTSMLRQPVPSFSNPEPALGRAITTHAGRGGSIVAPPTGLTTPLGWTS
jgi:hypothetical protein